MGVRNARLVSVALLVVLLGTPAAAVACAFDCAAPAPGSGAARVTAQGGAGCHDAPPPSAAVQLDRGERDNCRDHVLPGDGTAAVHTFVITALSQPPALAVAPAAASRVEPAATVRLAAGTIRGPSTSFPAVARPPLVLRI